MRISIAQIDSVIGDFAGNARKIADYARRAAAAGADLVAFPELAVCGYPPMDLLDQKSFAEECEAALRGLQKSLPPDVAVGLGYVAPCPRQGGKGLVNAYGFLVGGEVAFVQEKTLLPTYDVFDEARYFEPAAERRVFAFRGEKIGVAVCEDFWRESQAAPRYAADPVRDLLDRGATLLLVPSASPYYQGKLAQRRELAEKAARRGGVPVVYVNAVGANDSLVFDGRSFVAAGGPAGDVTVRAAAAAFREDLVAWDSALPAAAGPALPENAENELDVLEEALVLGIRGYMAKCGFKQAHLGLSGGIDSALVAYLAVRAVGPENVACFALPSRFSSGHSLSDARDLAATLGTRFEVLSIEKAFDAYLSTLETVFAGRPFDLAEENLQARIRGTLLMAYSNKFGSMLLTTGNKSELAMGYCTLYGDMSGAIAPIGDLLKTEVFALCRRINERSRASGGGAIIPESTISKPPSAELRPDQKDEDSLPPYDVLDAVLRLYLIDNLSAARIVALGWEKGLVTRVVRAVAGSEYKRRQAPPVVKVSPRAFGMGRRMPIARKVHEA